MIGRCRSASAVPRPSTPPTRCGLRNASSPASGSGLIATIGRAVVLGPLQRRQHSGVVGARVLADDEDQLGGVDVVERHRALADADRRAEGHAARLVAHVRAVRAGCWCRAPARSAGRRTRPRCSCAPTCRTRRGAATSAWRARRRCGRTRRPSRSARSGSRPADGTSASSGGPADPASSRSRRPATRSSARRRTPGSTRRSVRLLGDGLGPVLAELESRTCGAARARRTRGSRSRRAG